MGNFCLNLIITKINDGLQNVQFSILNGILCTLYDIIMQKSESRALAG
jgi:hypothetical protein